jgi:hypothetical protein
VESIEGQNHLGLEIDRSLIKKNLSVEVGQGKLLTIDSRVDRFGEVFLVTNENC